MPAFFFCCCFFCFFHLKEHSSDISRCQHVFRYQDICPDIRSFLAAVALLMMSRIFNNLPLTISRLCVCMSVCVCCLLFFGK